MTPHHPYIVLLPSDRTNKGKDHLVVHVDEWLDVSLHQKAEYEFSIGCDDYASAAAERDRLNHEQLGQCPPSKKSGISLARDRQTV